MDVATNVALMSLVFFLGTGTGALLNSLHRASRIEEIKTKFLREFEEQLSSRVRESIKPSDSFTRSA